jgi:hypothetical protein
LSDLEKGELKVVPWWHAIGFFRSGNESQIDYYTISLASSTDFGSSPFTPGRWWEANWERFSGTEGRLCYQARKGFPWNSGEVLLVGKWAVQTPCAQIFICLIFGLVLDLELPGTAGCLYFPMSFLSEDNREFAKVCSEGEVDQGYFFWFEVRDQCYFYVQSNLFNMTPLGN